MARLTGWRRIASAIWRAPNDPQIYGSLDAEASALVAYLEQARAAGMHVTPTHLVGRAVAHALAAVPDLNVRIVGSRAIPRESVDIFFITAVAGGHDLSGGKVRQVDRRSAADVALELASRAERLRGGRDLEFSRTKMLMDRLPRPLLHAAARGTKLVSETLNLDVKPLGLHASPFGSAMITSVGMFGLPQGYAPLAWLYDVPLIVLVGELTERPVVVDHQVVARPVLPLGATIDHRYVDGWHISKLLEAAREYLADPARFEPPLEAARGSA